jgi:hypothetical protein
MNKLMRLMIALTSLGLLGAAQRAEADVVTWNNSVSTDWGAAARAASLSKASFGTAANARLPHYSVVATASRRRPGCSILPTARYRTTRGGERCILPFVE